MMFNDNTLITLGQKTQIQITEYLWKPGDKNSAMVTTLKEGSFRVMGGSITRVAPENFTTNTPSGTIGIRGSMYAGMISGERLLLLFQGERVSLFRIQWEVWILQNPDLVQLFNPENTPLKNQENLLKKIYLS